MIRDYLPITSAESNIRKADAFAERVGPVASELRQRGLLLAQVAAEMTARGIATARGGPWTALAVRQVLRRYHRMMRRRGAATT